MDDPVLDRIVKDLRKKLSGRATVGRLADEGFASGVSEFIPSSCSLLNWAIGGGAAVGRITEILGAEVTGKSLLAMDFLANNQRGGGISAYLDSEFATNKDFAKRLVQIDDAALLHLEVDTQEDAWTAVEQTIATVRQTEEHRRLAIVLDSLAALAARESKAKTFDEQAGVVPEARIIRRALRKLVSEIASQQVAFIFTNHEIVRIGAGWGDSTQSWGGSGPRYMASTRLKLGVTGKILKDGEIAGIKCQAVVLKNRFDIPGRRIIYTINLRGPHLGIDDAQSLVDYLSSKGALGSRKGFVEFEGQSMRPSVLVERIRTKENGIDAAIKKYAYEVFQRGGNAVESADDVDGA